MKNRPDLVVLGGGSAAFAAAIRAADLGAADVRIFEEGVIGGTCVNRGCLPSKNLLHAAERYHHYRRPNFPGIPAGGDPIDFEAVMRQKDNLVGAMRKAKYLDVLEAYPKVRLVPRRARFVAPDAIEVAGDGDGTGAEGGRVAFGAAVVATGASPAPIPVPGLEEAGYVTYQGALDLKRLPPRLVVIGGGPIGLELGQFFSRCGAKVTILEALERIAPLFEPEVSTELARALAAEGIEVHAGARVTAVRREDGAKVVEAEIGGAAVRLPCDEILLAAGLKPNTADLGLEAAGVETDRRGFIQVDARMRTSNRRVYAAGDCAGAPMLVTAAALEGAIAAENAIGGLGTRADESAVPSAIFTDPPVAAVGLGEAAATRGRRRAIAQTIPYEHVPRAGAVRETAGCVKMVVEDGSYRVLGLHICGAGAPDVIMIGALAIRHRLTLGDLIRATFVYPTYAEAVKIAALSCKRDVAALSCCAA